MFYLQAVSGCVPEAVRTLVELDAGDETQLRAWAERWGFTDEWALSAARNHASFWREQPESIGLWLSVTVASWEPVFPRGPSWNPIKETEEAFRARVDAYIAAMKDTPGIVATPEKRRLATHLEWLALHHAGRLTYEQITQRYENTNGNPNEPATIGRAITDAAALVGLTLRHARGRKSR